ncbi:MAG: hypothetical protein ACK42C_00110 [Aquificaceae bacterium]
MILEKAYNVSLSVSEVGKLAVSPLANIVITALYEILKEDMLHAPVNDNFSEVHVISEGKGGIGIVYAGIGKVGAGWSNSDLSYIINRLSVFSEPYDFYYRNFLGRLVKVVIHSEDFVEVVKKVGEAKGEGRL